MKIKYIAFVLVLICCCNIASSQSDFESLRAKIAQQYIASSVNDNQINRLLNTIKSDGTWPGIDYVDTTRVAFQHGFVTDRVCERFDESAFASKNYLVERSGKRPS